MKVIFEIKGLFVANVLLLVAGIALDNDLMFVAGIINLSTMSLGLHILEAIHDK